MKEISQQQLVAIILYHIANNEICGQLFDPQKCFEFKISSNPHGAGFTVDYQWYDGIKYTNYSDPTIGDVEKYIEREGGFRILLTESLETLFKYLTDMCNEINENDFEVE